MAFSATRRWIAVLGLIGSGAGCNQAAPATAQVERETSTEIRLAAASDDVGLPTVSISNKSASITKPEPQKGSAEWLIQEIMRIRLLPYPAISDADDETNEDAADADVERSAEDEEKLAAAQQAAIDERKKLRRERNDEIIALATECMVKCNRDPEQEQYFNAAVHHLLDARMQLALQGDAEQRDELYDTAESLQKRQPGSPSAAAAQLSVVNLTHALALRFGKQNTQHIAEFAKQSSYFATEFPKEQRQSLPMLLAAARSCELNGLMDEAINCYGAIHTQFPDSPQAQQVAGVLRRLDLPGKTLDLAGPTIEGSFLNIEDYREKAVVVVFWASNVKGFAESLPTLQKVSQRYAKYAQFIGVNMDVDESNVDEFLEKTGLAWPQIFQPETAKRGWNSPLAGYYGVTSLPTIWLVDPHGKVADTQVDPEKLDAQLKEMLTQHLKRTK